MTRSLLFVLALAAAAPLLAPADVAAQYSDELRANASRPSNERFAFEMKVGTYGLSGDTGNRYFGNDHGPLLQLEFDVLAFRIPYFGHVGVGGIFGWVKYSAKACTDESCTNRTDDGVRLRAFPLAPVAVLRIDALSHDLGIPLVLVGKIGLDTFIYDVHGGTGGSGITYGVRWAAQAALELDFINRRRARSLDEEWGINHTYLLCELFGSTADLADRFAWTLGLGLTF